MAEITEKRIRIAVDGVEKELANLNKVDAIAAEITKEFQRQGRVIDKQVNAQIQKMARELANSRTQVKGLRAQFRGLFKEVISAGGASGGISGLFGGIIGGFTGGALSSAVEGLITQLGEYVFAASDAEQANKELEEATASAAGAFAEEAVTLETNISILRDTSLEYDDRKEALEALQEQYPEYLKNLELDQITNEQLDEVYKKITDSISRRIQQQAIANLAEQKFVEIQQKTLEQQNRANNLNELSSLSWFQVASALLTAGGAAAQNAKNVANLADEAENANSEYDKLIEQLKEFELTSTDSDKNEKKRNTTRKQVSQKNQEILDTVKDLNSAIKALQDVQKEGEIEAIDRAKKLVKLYGEQAVEANDAEAAVERNDKFLGKSQQELRDYLAETKASFDDLDNAVSVAQFNFKELFSTGYTIDAENNPLVQIFEDGTQLDIKRYKGRLNEIFAEVLARPEGQIVTSEFREAYLQALEEGFVFPVIDARVKAVNEARILGRELEAELQAIKKQQEKTGVASAEILNKVNEALEAAETEIVERRIEAQEKLTKATQETPEILARALEAAGVTNVEEIRENVKNQIEQGLEAGLDEIEKRAAEFTGEFSKLYGDILKGSADEGFFLDTDAIAGLDDKTKAELVARVEDLNKEVSLTFKKYRNDIKTLDIQTYDTLIKNAAVAGKQEKRRLQAELEAKELEYSSHYADVLESNERFAERMRKQNGELSDDDINFIRNQKEKQIKLRQEALDLELRIETDAAINLLEQAEDDSEAKELVLKEFNNKKKKIINEYQKDLEKIDADFEKIFDGKDPTGEDKFKKILNDIVQVAQQAAVLINNIFTLVEQRQQAVIDALQDNLDKVEDQLSQAQSNINELEDDLEGKRSGRREAVLRAIAQEQEREERLAAKKLELSKKIREEEIKLAKQRKAAAITQAIINGALAITNIWATVPKADWGVTTGILTGISAAITATEIALIASQKFARGGHTGSGGERDETGHRVAGVVHDNEWVAPKWMVQSPTYSGVIQELENARTRGFADGGFTTPDFGGLVTAASPAGQQQLAKMIQNSVEASLRLADRPIIAKATEFTNVSAKSARRINATTIGG